MPLDGECIKETFFMIGSQPVSDSVTLSLPTATTNDCCSDFFFNVLADPSDDAYDDFKNDKNGFINWFADVVTAAVFKLQKLGADDTYADIETLNNDDFGTLYALGFYTNDEGENYIGYQIDWRDVIKEHGAGTYRIKLTTTSAVAGSADLYSNDYSLKAYTPERADGTVKIEYYLNGIIGDNADDTKRRDFGTLNWYNAVRIRGFFGFDASKYETEFIKYETGQQQWISDDQFPEYTLKSGLLPAVVHNLMRTDVLQGDQVLITDYNKNNPNRHVQRGVKRNSEYTPEWDRRSRLAPVEVKFIQEYQNNKRHRCTT